MSSVRVCCTIPAWLPPGLESRCQCLTLEKGSWLFRLGDPVESVYWIESGEIRAIRHLLDGSSAIMIRAKGGQFFGESSMLLSNYTCDAEVVKRTSVKIFPVSALREEMNNNGAFAFQFSMSMAAHARKQCSSQERLRLKKARDRVLHYLGCEFGGKDEIDIDMPMAELAIELGLEAETLYRTLSKLEEEQVIQREKRHIRLLTA